MAMYRDIIKPSPSKRLSEVVQDIESWELQLTEYYKCGGEKLGDQTKVMTAMLMLPPDMLFTGRARPREAQEQTETGHSLLGGLRRTEEGSGTHRRGSQGTDADRSVNTGPGSLCARTRGSCYGV